MTSFNNLVKTIHTLFHIKYKTDKETYNNKVVSDIIYNEKTKIVSIFKDYLIWDDSSEFLRRIYTINESRVRLNKIIGFYSKYSKIFPNYIILPESKYLYKNIRKKQKMIDSANNKGNKDNLEHSKVFNSIIKNSLLKYNPSNKNVFEESRISIIDMLNNLDFMPERNINININQTNIIVMDNKMNKINKNIKPKPILETESYKTKKDLYKKSIKKGLELLSARNSIDTNRRLSDVKKLNYLSPTVKKVELFKKPTIISSFSPTNNTKDIPKTTRKATGSKFVFGSQLENNYLNSNNNNKKDSLINRFKIKSNFKSIDFQSLMKVKR